MICTKPFVKGLHAFPCGQCDPCRANRKKLWTHRIHLESLNHEHNSFVTLTYLPDAEPLSPSNLGTLLPSHLTNFLKRLRRSYEPLKLRYFAVGEYGDASFRPHYHLALFGFPVCHRRRTEHRLSTCCPVCDLLASCWDFGAVDSRPLEVGSARYIAGYVTKKMTKPDDERLKDRHPEFTRMSLKPGLGALSMEDIAANLLSAEGGRVVALQEDVPTSLMMGSKPFPLGRYLRRKLREQLGLPPGAPPEVLQKWEAEMHDLLLDAFGPRSHSNPWTRIRIRDFLVRHNAGKIANTLSRLKIFNQKRSI